MPQLGQWNLGPLKHGADRNRKKAFAGAAVLKAPDSVTAGAFDFHNGLFF